MSSSTSSQRLDKIEIQLTPKQWAIGLADEMRRHSSEHEFEKYHTKKIQSFREWPNVKPFFALAEQAQRRCPGTKPLDIRAHHQLNRKLRAEFHTLKLLIRNINDTIRQKMERLELKAALTMAALDALILREVLSRTAKRTIAWIERHKPDHKDQGRRVILGELACCADVGSSARNTDGLLLAVGVSPRLSSSITDLANDSAKLIMDALAYKTAVQVVQEKYFDGHPILCCDIEAALEKTTQAILDAAATLNEYQQKRANLSSREKNHKHKPTDGIVSAKGENKLIINIEAIRDEAGTIVSPIVDGWVEGAQQIAVALMLEETGEDEEFILKCLRENFELTTPDRN